MKCASPFQLLYDRIHTVCLARLSRMRSTLSLFSFSLYQNPLRAQANPGNSTIAFADNSSALQGFVFDALRPAAAAAPSPYVAERADYGTRALYSKSEMWSGDKQR